MKILESAENYLESILILRNEKGRVRSIDIVNHLGFSKPSVSIAMKQLEENGYITRDEDGHIFLTDAGKKIAQETYERHVFLTDLFVRCGVSEETAREDACRMEHVISPDSFAAIKKYVGDSGLKK